MKGSLRSGDSVIRRLLMRGVVVFGAVWIGGHVMRSLPHDQTLIFPVGSVFPSATRFSASWKAPGDSEPRGGMTLAFTSPPPLQVRQHASLPNGDYVVSVEVVAANEDESEPKLQINEKTENGSNPALIPSVSRGVQTNLERRVSLSGGETLVALATGGF